MDCYYLLLLLPGQKSKKALNYEKAGERGNCIKEKILFLHKILITE